MTSPTNDVDRAGHESRPVDHEVVRITDLSKTFHKRGLKALDNVDVTLRHGTFTSVIGPSGCGKSTLLKIMAGLIPATTGEILGAHLVGPEVTELLPELVLARIWELTPEEIARAVHAHPTLSEAIMEAAHGVFGAPIHA